MLKITGLHITGQSVTGTGGDMTHWSNQCFGQDLTFKKQRAIRGAIKLSVLREKFMEVPPNATEVELDRHTRAYALYVLGSSLFSSSFKGMLILSIFHCFIMLKN